MANRKVPYEYVKRFYGVNPVIGGRVTSKYDGRTGVVVRKRVYDHYVRVRFDGVKFDVPCHPLDLYYAAVVGDANGVRPDATLA